MSLFIMIRGCLQALPTQEIKDIKVNSLLDDNGKWDVDILTDLFTKRDVNCILSIPHPTFLAEDGVYLEGDNKVIYIVKCGYWHLTEEPRRKNEAQPFPWHRL